MYSYFVSDCDYNLLKQINEMEFENFKKYKKDLDKFSNLFDCYQNYSESEIVVKQYIENIDEYGTRNLNNVYRACKYIFMQNIMFGRIMIDNAKSYCNQLDRFELKRRILEFEESDEFKMLKLLRDFGQHFSLPFDNVRIEYNSSDERTRKVEPLISVNELKRNKSGNKQNKVFLQSIQDNEISIMNYLEKWSIKLDELYVLIKRDFSSFTSKDTSHFIKNSILCFIENSNGYIPVGLSKMKVLAQNSGQFQTIEFVPFDEIALFELFN
ncbi:hypothetical protein [Streptococcus parasanguinis]|mgnify:FL=1|jgi:hypothetical protein|uniref:hypothetical protein n=1 Tax=Streptococcus parasanguinis TaxID=1318 RepID=UPI00066A346F|nr:hypothetical protein [Streptococcus parasanguinis]